MKIVAIGAHPDDIEYYAGGTLSQMAASGDKLILVIATDGRYGSPDKDPINLVHIRQLEQQNAANVLGAMKVVNLNYEDGSLENNIQKLKKDLLKILVREKPEIVFTFDPQKQYMIHEDFHPDHRALAVAVLDIILIDYTLPAKVQKKLKRPKIFLYNAYRFNKTVRLGKHLKIKRAALKNFVSQDLKFTGKDIYLEKFRVY